MGKQIKEFRASDSLPRRKRFLFSLAPVLVCLGLTAIVLSIFFRVVDLKPQVNETFFFSKEDPQVRVDNQILSLRNKLEPEPTQPQFLLTVHGVGYAVEDGPA